MKTLRTKGMAPASILLACLVVMLVGLASSRARDHKNQPDSIEPIAQTLAEGTLQLFTDVDFKGDQVTINIENAGREQIQSLRNTKAWRRMSSLKWNLPGGVLVVFYSEEKGSGRQYAVWRSGEDSTLSDNNFDNAAEAWAWYKN